jgi:RNA-directed DNA polymerase
MTQQKSDDCVVPEGPRKLAQTRDVESRQGGKAVTGNEQAIQLVLFPVTAASPEVPKTKVASPKARELLARTSEEAPKAASKDKLEWSTTLEQAVKLLSEAFERVASNKGAPGPDRQTIGMVQEHLPKILTELETALLKGTYQPGDIRRVWIPKSDGKLRGLGIPNVIDRIVQQAVRMVLEPVFEPKFHPSSHGFRPGRSCHTAITEARKHIAEGFNMVVDLDLAKFFDRVCHQRLMARIAQRVSDRGLLVLIGKMLKAKVVMPDGVKVHTEEGVPQGGPLSPLLSNIVLDELDWELERRGHRFVRYADDCNIFVRSERAGHRVMESVSQLIEKRLRLEVNREKSAVARPEERHFLGFTLQAHDLNVEPEVNLSKRSKERLAERVVELTPRSWGSSLKACIQKKVSTVNFFAASYP